MKESEIPEEMNAVLLTGHGDLSNLEYQEGIPVPHPESDEVLVKVSACGLNNTDIWTRKAAYGSDDEGWKGSLDFPIIQGADIAGKIVDVGMDVSQGRIGDRVLVDNALYSDQTDEFQSLINAGLIGSEKNGGYAEFAAAPESNAYRVDCNFSDAELATFPTSYVTAERMLNRAGVQSGETVFVTGASGGVGTGLIQLAQRRNAVVIALTNSSKKDMIEGIGVDEVICRDEETITDEIKNRLEDGKVDVVADVVGGDQFSDFLEILHPGGRLVTAGAVAGPVVDLDLRTVYLKQIEIIGSTMGTKNEFRDLIQYIDDRSIKPLLAESYPLSEIHDAQRRFLENNYLGSVVVKP